MAPNSVHWIMTATDWRKYYTYVKKKISKDVKTYLCHTSYNPRLNRLFNELYDKYQNKQVVLIYESGDEMSGTLIFADMSAKLMYYLDYSY